MKIGRLHRWVSKIGGRAGILFLASGFGAFQTAAQAQSCQISVSPTTVNACLGDQVPLLVTGGNGTYTWAANPALSCTNCANPVVTANQNTTLYVTSGGTGSQNAVNGAFTQGNTGFTSQYNFNATSIWNEGTYAITTSANLVHPNFSAWPDHTTGTGMYMAVNGSVTANKVFWQQAVPLPPGAQVTMTYWILTMATPASSVRTKVNNVNVGQVLAAPLTTGVWTQHQQVFTAGTGATTLVTLESVYTASAGNDFALDDISFAYNCQDTDTVQVVAKPKAVLTLSLTDTTGCGTVCPTFAGSVSGPAVTGLNWDFGDGTTAAGFNPTHCYTTPGTYTVSLSGTTLGGCTTTLSRPSVTVLPGANLSATPTDTTGCGALCVTWTNTSTFTPGYPLQSVLWEFGDGTSDTAWSPTHCYAAPGQYTVRLTVSVAGGCTTTRTWLRQVRIGAYPQIGIVPTRTRLYPDSAQVGFQVTGAPAGSTFAWVLGDGTTATTPGLVHTYVPDTHYVACVVVTSPEGCSDTACVDLWSAIRIQLPNLVTPNNDAKNDFWMPEVVGHDWLRWEIHDRWGQRVFTTEERGATWDGTFNGRPVPEGVYFVSVKAGNGGGLRGQAAGAVHVFR